MSGGYAYGEPEPTRQCPYCKANCDADFVDVGIGYQQCGPYHCDNCEASEIGPCDEERELTPDEERTWWYAPGSKPGSSANVIEGRFVSHEEMRRRYVAEYPASATDEWREKIRGPENRHHGT